MEIERAKEIISALAEGIDPTTGELLPQSSVCNNGDVVRALYSVLNALNKPKSKELPRAKTKMSGRPWSDQEDVLLKELYLSGKTQSELSERLQRSKGGIRARLKRLGLIDK